MLIPLSPRRFRDGKGNRVDLVGLLYAPRALTGCLMRILFGYRPVLPWLSFRAIRTLDRLIQPSWKILEFGSGMSTLWLARRCSFLHSIESNRGWYQNISWRLAREHLNHVRYELRDPAGYADLRQYPNGFFDFVLVDGLCRSDCVRQALTKVRAGGWIYIDNCDTDLESADGDMRIAEGLLREEVAARQGSWRYFVDFAPTQFFVQQGVLAQLQAAGQGTEAAPRPASVQRIPTESR